MHFARTLRAAGLPVGPGKVIDAVQAVASVGVTNRADFYWTLHAIFVNRPDQRQLFDQAFHVFWRNPELLKKMLATMLPQMNVEMPRDEGAEMIRRLAEALHPHQQTRESPEEQVEIDAAMTFSDREQLRTMDFEKMSLEELARAKAAIARLVCRSTTSRPAAIARDPRGARADMRATLRAALRSGGLIELKRQSPRRRPPPLVVLCDISGSMSRYSRVFLHFMHSVTNDRDRVFTFVFGTRLTNITRFLRYRDVDVALDKVAEAVADWSGGTRIGQCVREFNRFWSRRVLGPGRDRADDHRRARPRRRDGSGGRDGPAAPLLPQADLAQPAVALRGVRAKIIGYEGDAALCRRVPAGAQSRKPGDADRA